MLRPDNLEGGVAMVRGELRALGLAEPAAVFGVQDLDPERERQARVLWDTAYAGPDPIERYEIYRREEKIASLPFAPQTSHESFSFVDKHAPDRHEGGVWYRVRAVDAAGNAADSVSVRRV